MRTGRPHPAFGAQAARMMRVAAASATFARRGLRPAFLGASQAGAVRFFSGKKVDRGAIIDCSKALARLDAGGLAAT